jgi:hypothetical protein
MSFRVERSGIEESLFFLGFKERCLDKLGMTACCIAYAEAYDTTTGMNLHLVWRASPWLNRFASSAPSAAPPTGSRWPSVLEPG